MSMLGDCDICLEYDNLRRDSTGALWVCPQCSDVLMEIDSDDQDDFGIEFTEQVMIKERPISTRRKRKLRKKGKNVYWSKRLECNVYVMEPKR